MKTVYLHIGTPKTATSSIQNLCLVNREELHKYGFSYEKSPFDYPGVNSRRNAHFLVGPRKIERLIPGKEEEYRKQLRTGFSMVHEQFEKYDHVILTDENLWWSVNYGSWNGLKLLTEDASRNGYNVKVLVYLRRQDDYLISRWNQLIKERRISESLPLHLRKVLSGEPLLVNYDESLDRIAKIVGKENIIVRRFERSSWVNGSVYDDFKDAIGLGDAFLKIPEQNENMSLKNNFVEFQRMVNRMDGLSQKEKDDISICLRRASNRAKESHPTSMLSAQERMELLAKFDEGNERVADEYIGDGKPLFDMKMTELTKWERNNNDYLKDAMAFICELPRENRELLNTDEILEPLSENENSWFKRMSTGLLIFVYKIKYSARSYIVKKAKVLLSR